MGFSPKTSSRSADTVDDNACFSSTGKYSMGSVKTVVAYSGIGSSSFFPSTVVDLQPSVGGGKKDAKCLCNSSICIIRRKKKTVIERLVGGIFFSLLYKKDS